MPKSQTPTSLMSIRFKCPNGHELNVKNKYAGLQALCPQCQTRVLVPVPAGELTDDAVVGTLSPPPPYQRDGRPLDVLSHQSRLTDPASNDTPVPTLRTVKVVQAVMVQTVDVQDAVVQRVDWQPWEEQQCKLPLDQRPFELKGDRLGMPLQTFKNKYHRAVGGRVAPFCSDEKPDMDISTLDYKAEYAKAAIVHGRTTFPFEEYGLDPNFATIAGVKADLFIYAFVDEKLYEIRILFSHDS